MAQWIYGRNAVEGLLHSEQRVLELYAADTMKNDAIVKEALKKKIPVFYVPKTQLHRMSGTEKHQGLLAKAEDYRTYTLQEIIDGAKKKYPLIVILDGLEDPHNLGAILRSADAVNADGVIYAKNRSVSLNPTVAKVAVGAINTVKVAEVTNLVNAIEKLKDHGYWIVAAANKDSRDYRTIDYKCPIALVIGNEGKGISRLVLENSDFRAGLPMKGKVNSLNASVAAGIFLYGIESNRFPPTGEAKYEKENQ
ncbi:MAG: 23S rRNA (guanosine(2251)-2'-O)-methyltransferase RlmB [Erysipelotrichales bacterium]|nr:23S rRNA (guanosine(2251)-2'-O)-methyltransferase RlmB [Erysipelotrichales bacterium]